MPQRQIATVSMFVFPHCQAMAPRGDWKVNTCSRSSVNLFHWEKSLHFCVDNVGFNVTENHHSSSFAMEIVITLPYPVLCWRIDFIYSLSTMSNYLNVFFVSCKAVTDQDQFCLMTYHPDCGTIGQWRKVNFLIWGWRGRSRQKQEEAKSSFPPQAAESIVGTSSNYTSESEQHRNPPQW